MTNTDFERDSPVMMSSTMPSAKYSCSGPPLIVSNGSTAMEGLSGSGRAGFGCSVGISLTAPPAGFFASRTVPTKRNPFRGNVLMRRCFSPVSPIACRATFRRVVSAASDTLRPFQMAFMRSSLLTTRSRLRIR